MYQPSASAGGSAAKSASENGSVAQTCSGKPVQMRDVQRGSSPARIRRPASTRTGKSPSARSEMKMSSGIGMASPATSW